MQRIVVVGNGVINHGLGKVIDNADLVIRFNNAKLEPERTGTRTDILFLMNSGRTMQERLRGEEFLRSEVLVRTDRVLLPYHPLIIERYHPKPRLLSRMKGRRADWTVEAINRIGALGKEITLLSPRFYEESCAELGLPAQQMRMLFPSTGYLGIRYALERLLKPGGRIEICGFGWQGWKRHPWTLEKSWIEGKIQNGDLLRYLVAPDPAIAAT